MRFFTLALAISLLSLQGASALDRKEILRISKQPHSRENLLPELEVFADAREYTIAFELQETGASPVAFPPITARSKVVEGRYLFTVFRPAGAPGDVAAVISYDQESATYRKWILIPDGHGTVHLNIGTAVPGSRAISWVNTNDPDNLVLTHEQHSDTGATWTETHLAGGEVVRRVSGVATKTR
jgi:hypothetical protein